MCSLTKNCPFCWVPELHGGQNNPLAYSRRDGFPISKGRTIIIPRRHIASLFECMPVDELPLSSMGCIDMALGALMRDSIQLWMED